MLHHTKISHLSLLRKLMILFVASPLLSCGDSSENALTSPDGQYKLTINKSKETQSFYYTVDWSGENIIKASKLGFTLSDGTSLPENLEIIETSFTVSDNKWKPVCGEQKEYRDHYKEMVVKFSTDKSAIPAFGIKVRAYDEGVAFKYEFYTKNKISIKEELTEFAVDPKSKAWISSSAQGPIEEEKVSALSPNVRYERPFLMQQSNSTFVAIGEAALMNFARMKLSPDTKKSGVLTASLDPSGIKGVDKVVLEGDNHASPWRYIMAGRNASQILQNNQLLLNLNEPCQIKDISWIKSGKVLREISITTVGSKACIDFAKRNNFKYILYDAGWYGDEKDDKSDATIVNPQHKHKGDFDLHETINYAKKNGIGVILYINRRVIERQEEDLFPLYKKWGVAGVKFGFVNVGSQYWTNWVHKAVAHAAKYHLIVDIHDEYRPTGVTRTYPNLLTQEGIRGDETGATNEQVINTIYTRMIAGAGDQTNCYFEDRVEDKMGSRTSQMAKSIALFSPMQHLYWYDMPVGLPKTVLSNQKEIIESAETDFFKQLPTEWDQSLMLDGYPGKYALVARKKDRIWFVGAITGKEGKEFVVDYSFLDYGAEYEATIYTDYLDAKGKKCVKVDTSFITKADIVKYKVDKMNGLAIIARPARVAEGLTKRIIKPVLPNSVKISYPNSNPLREALEPLEARSIFKMEGYGLWDPSVIKVDGVYHLFCSRWPLEKGWFYSEVIRATSSSLYGPYEFKEVVLSAETHPWATKGTHNPKITKIGSRYLLYHLGIPQFQTGFAYADNIEGPWEVMKEPVIKTNNPAIVVHKDGSAYAIGKFTRTNEAAKDGLYDACMRAFRAPSVNGPYTVVKDMGNRLPNEFEYEDPSVFWANDTYHVICTDWEGKVTGVQKSLIYYTSKDGVDYELYSQIPIWNQAEPIPMKGGGETYITQIERPEAYINEKGEFEALLVGVISRPEVYGKIKDNHIMIRKVKNFKMK